MTGRDQMLTAALGYAKQGWPVFPCSPKAGKGGKKPLVLPDKDPETGKSIPRSGWPKKATTDKATIYKWWADWPDALIGVPLGHTVGAFVVDCDPRDGETVDQVLARLQKVVGCGFAHVPTSVTQSGGVHLWFAYPAKGKLGNRAGVIPHVDVRGDGGYVIVPPSAMSNGNSYDWMRSPRDFEFRFPDAPKRLLDAVLRRGEFAHGTEKAAGGKKPSAKAQEHDEAVRRYAGAALTNQVNNVATAAQGTRNQALNDAALSLGKLVAAGALTEAAVRAELTAAAERSGLLADDGPRQIEATLSSGLRAGMAQPFDLSQVRGRPAGARGGGARGDPTSSQTGATGTDGGQWGEGARSPPGGRDDGDDLDRKLAWYPLTDLGNAERFCARHKGRLLYCPALGWLWWDGRRWSIEGAEEKVKIAEHETVRAIQGEAATIRDTDADKVVKETRNGIVLLSDTIAGWGRASESVTRLAAISKRAGPYLAVAANQLDTDPWKINVWNGTLTVKRGEGDDPYVRFAPHDPSDLITKISPTVYEPKAECPRFGKFLRDVQPKDDNRRFLAQWNGLSMTGDISEQRLVVLWGTGKNGKSTLVDIIGHVLGDYSDTVPIETFLTEGRGRNAGQATPDLAILPGIRHLRTSEPDKGAKLSEALIKLATGGEPMQVRHLNKDYFKFYPQFKLTISGNYRPRIQGTDEGIWRRVSLVPWPVEIAKADRDKKLGDKLKGEAPGILNWLLDGLCDWLDNGLIDPEDVVAATEAYRSDSDPLGRFLDACVEHVPGEKVQSSIMHELFNAWAAVNGERQWSNKGMTMALRERGFQSKHSDVVWWLDLKLTRRIADYKDHDGNPVKRSDDDKDDDDGGDDFSM